MKYLIAVCLLFLVPMLVAADNLAIGRPYKLNLPPIDGYRDDEGSEPFTQVGKYYRGELTDGNPGECMGCYTGWLYQDTPLIVEVVIDLGDQVPIKEIHQYFTQYSREMQSYTLSISDDGESFQALETNVTTEDVILGRTLKVRIYKSMIIGPTVNARYLKSQMVLNQAGFLHTGEIMIFDKPLDIETSNWHIVKTMR